MLDTSALLTLFLGEEGEGQVIEVLESGEPLYLPFMALMEFEYMTERERGLADLYEALRLIRAWPASLVESNQDWGRAAARLKAKARLSLGDAWNASLALLLDAELVHKDPEFDEVTGLKSLRLPYKPKTR
ncbi:MAG TPA: PIN domain-containing protein [Thermoanaerobaculia bacterium]|nr:PIN domain-containing protein [Thermoanaerobaculia bacterium]